MLVDAGWLEFFISRKSTGSTEKGKEKKKRKPLQYSFNRFGNKGVMEHSEMTTDQHLKSIML